MLDHFQGTWTGSELSDQPKRKTRLDIFVISETNTIRRTVPACELAVDNYQIY